MVYIVGCGPYFVFSDLIDYYWRCDTYEIGFIVLILYGMLIFKPRVFPCHPQRCFWWFTHRRIIELIHLLL